MVSGLAKGALLIIGAGVIARYTGAGVGLAELGKGVVSLAAAPLTGTGLGLSGLAGGITDIAESLGDIGRGIGEIFKSWQDWFGFGQRGGAMPYTQGAILPVSTSGASTTTMNTTILPQGGSFVSGVAAPGVTLDEILARMYSGLSA